MSNFVQQSELHTKYNTHSRKKDDWRSHLLLRRKLLKTEERTA
jgi:hypothetical protein